MTMNQEERHKIRQYHNPNGKPIVTSLKKTGSNSPTSWQGETLGGEPVYVRFRHNMLKIQIGAVPLDNNEPHLVIKKEVENTEHSGSISASKMRKHLKRFVKFEI